MAEDKQPHEKMRDKESDLKAAQKVHYTDDFKKADKAGEEQLQENEEKKNNDN